MRLTKRGLVVVAILGALLTSGISAATVMLTQRSAASYNSHAYSTTHYKHHHHYKHHRFTKPTPKPTH